MTEFGVEQFSINTDLKSNPWEFNSSGYFEDTTISLLCDQLIRLSENQRRASFLYPPSFSKVDRLKNFENLNHSFFYDLDEGSVQIPTDFETDLVSYTGSEWDQWGITRMREGGKWYKCYSKIKVDTYRGMDERIRAVHHALSSTTHPIFIKDPRLAFTLHFFGLTNFKGIWVKRDPQQTLRSMRRHYGPRLFTERIYPGFDWVSNHFNYQVPGQEFLMYVENYEKWIEFQLRGRSVLEVQLERLGTSSFDHELRSFLNEAS